MGEPAPEADWSRQTPADWSGETPEQLEAERAAEEAEYAYRDALEDEKKKLEAMLAPVNWEGTPRDDEKLTWWSRLREIELELEGKTTVAAQTMCFCQDVVSAGAPGTLSCAKCGTTFHSECIIEMLQHGAQYEYEARDEDDNRYMYSMVYDKACPSCSHNMITGKESAKMLKDRRAREADARQAQADRQQSAGGGGGQQQDQPAAGKIPLHSDRFTDSLTEISVCCVGGEPFNVELFRRFVQSHYQDDDAFAYLGPGGVDSRRDETAEAVWDSWCDFCVGHGMEADVVDSESFEPCFTDMAITQHGPAFIREASTLQEDALTIRSLWERFQQHHAGKVPLHL
eukprot:SAG22_NODE_1378_length_4547_cov_77.305755_4_plen_343_part_00